MEDSNGQMKGLKTADRLRVKLANGVVFFVLLIALSSCSVMKERYIFPTIPQYNGFDGEGQVVFQLFAEDFLVDNEVGIHQVGSRQQKLKTMTGEVAKAMQTLIALKLVEKNHAIRLTDKNLWDLSVGDLARQDDNTVIIGGRIRKFFVQASTITARVKTEYEFVMEIDCYVGKSQEKKVVKRTVRFVKEMLNISHSDKIMNSLLDEFLREAALQVAENIESYL